MPLLSSGYTEFLTSVQPLGSAAALATPVLMQLAHAAAGTRWLATILYARRRIGRADR
jgi:hypothetical protein